MAPQGPAAAAGHTSAAALAGAAAAAQVGAAATAAAAATAHEAGLVEPPGAMMAGRLAALAGTGLMTGPPTGHQGPLTGGAGTAGHPRHAQRRAMVAAADHPCAGDPQGRPLAMMVPGTDPTAPGLASGHGGRLVTTAGTDHQALTGTALTLPTTAAATAHAAAATAEVPAGAGHVTVQYA